MLDPKKVPVLILAGGLGTRLSEETQARPKPMVEIGEMPILLHLMRSYYAHGFNDFVICAGYRAWDIKEYFLHYKFRSNHLAIDHRETQHDSAEIFGRNDTQERWRVRIIDTGLETMTGGRVARALDAITDSITTDKPGDKSEKFDHFAVTYGDGLCDVNLTEELRFHEKHGKIGTMLGVTPVSRFGELNTNAEGLVEEFIEKPTFSEQQINGGFMFFKKEFRSYLSDAADCIFERKPLEKLARDRQMMLFKHKGFWQCMDTLRDKMLLQSLWDKGEAPWFKKG